MHMFRVYCSILFHKVCLLNRTCRKIQGQCCGFRGFHNLVTDLMCRQSRVILEFAQFSEGCEGRLVYA